MKYQYFKLDNINFYDYKIATVMIDGVKMFVASDLLNQYNQKHNTNRRFIHYLEDKQTKELLMNWPNDTDGRNSDYQCNTVENADLWDIPHIIKYINLEIFSGMVKGYVVCEQLLNCCLMWVDPLFAVRVSHS